jgi:protein SCO1
MKGLRLLQGVLILMGLLLIPVLIILFLKVFGKNNYEIPVFYETGVDNPFRECEFEENVQHLIPEFKLISHLGDSVDRQVMQGKITIVDFFFTSCPSICPIMSSEMERVNNVFLGTQEVQILSISIDPEFDTPEVLKDYADRHDAKEKKWLFLSGEKNEIYNLARCGFILPTMHGGAIPDDFVHSDKFVLVDDLGRIRGYYSGTNKDEVDRLIVETKILLYGNQ